MLKNLSNGRARRANPRRRWRAALGALALLAFAGACDRWSDARRHAAATGSVETDSMGAVPRDVSSVRTRGPRELGENSGAAMSVRQPGVFFTINDSGNEPELFALDTTGAARGVWRVLGARNVDWESIAVGACSAAGSASPTAESCVYIGDTGDNSASHRDRVIYRVREPSVTRVRGAVRSEALRFTYADGPHDVEAMYLAPTGDLLLITKRPLTDAAGQLRPALVFALPAGAWSESAPVVAQLVDSLPIVPGSASLRTITDASLAVDARHLAVRTYVQVFVFSTDSITGRVDHAIPPATCDITSLDEPQGEGITWADGRSRLLLTSEGRNAPLRLATCS